MIYLHVPRRAAPPAVGADKRAPAAVAGEYFVPDRLRDVTDSCRPGFLLF